MNRIWWQLPGPSSFVERVAGAVEDGRSVVLVAPPASPDDLLRRVTDAVPADWHRFDAAEAGTSPAAFLLDRFDPDADVALPRNVRTLAASARCCGLMLAVEVRSRDAWDAWRPMLHEFAEHSRAIDPLDRSVFCVLVDAGTAGEARIEGPAIAWHRWDDVVSEHDMALYAATLLRPRTWEPVVRRAAAAVIAHVACWDPATADRLAAEDLRRIFEPMPVLEQIARERGWAPDCIGDENAWSWRRGLAQRVDGTLRVHSALLAAAERYDALAHRVWTGQVAVLFPFIEEHRRALISRLGSRLSVPYELRNGYVIRDVRDLEVSHIYWQLRQANFRVHPWMSGAVEALMDMRNALAHFDPVSATALGTPEIRYLATDWSM